MDTNDGRNGASSWSVVWSCASASSVFGGKNSNEKQRPAARSSEIRVTAGHRREAGRDGTQRGYGTGMKEGAAEDADRRPGGAAPVKHEAEAVPVGVDGRQLVLAGAAGLDRVGIALGD